MKVAILSESPADEAALAVLVEAVLGCRVDAVPSPCRRAGGIGWVTRVLPATIKWLRYFSDADHLVVVVDSNSSPVHTGPIGERCQDWEKCRLCRLRHIAARAASSSGKPASPTTVQIALGLPVPTIEAWLLCGSHPSISENAWVQGLRESRVPYSRSSLKQLAYGTDRPELALETSRAIALMKEVVKDLDLLERKFPVGFGCLRRDLESWARPSTRL